MRKLYSVAVVLLVALGAKAATVIVATCVVARLVHFANESKPLPS